MSNKTISECQSFLRLLADLNSLPIDLNDYTDEKQCYNCKYDEYFLRVLCWAGWREKRQKTVWNEVRNTYSRIGKELSTYQPSEIEVLRKAYPLPWQKKWAEKLVHYLRSNSLTTQKLVVTLRQIGYQSARARLQEIIDTDSEKIVDCWLRDIVKLDAFPIDSRIRKLFGKYGIPGDSNFVVDCCKQNSIPVRALARALYENAENLLLNRTRQERMR